MEDLWFKIKYFLARMAHYKRRNRLQRYGLTLILVLLNFITISLLPPFSFRFIHPDAWSLLTLTSAVTISAWFGGLGPGILTTVLITGMNYSLILNKDIAHRPLIGDQIMTAISIILGLAISIISEARYESEEEKDTFIALVAHELKNPLSSIKGYSQLMTSPIKKPNLTKIQNYADNIQFQSDKLLELINDLLDATKVEVGNFTYKDEPFNFCTLVKETVENQKVINKKRQLLLSGKSKKVIFGDKYRIRQVITNLLTNAIKYSPPNTDIEIKVKDKPSGVTLSVKDQGVGIPRIEQNHIFNRFYRTKKTEGGRTNGLGLGLFISSQIVKHYHGKMWVKSKEGKGSIFFLQLPYNYTT